MTETDTKPSSTPVTSQPSFLPISVQNTSAIRPIHKWQFYTVNAITWTLDTALFAVAGAKSDNGKFGIYAYNISNFEERWFQELRNVPFGMTINPNTHAIFVPLLGGSNFVLDTATGKVLKQVDYNVTLPCRGGIESDFLPDSKQVFILNTDFNESTEIYIWDIETDRCVGTFLREQGVAFDFEISHDGQLLVLALRDIPAPSSPGEGKVYKQQVQVWSIQTRKRICDFEGAQPALFTPDGNMIVTGNANQEGNVDLRDAKTCQILYTFYPQGQKGPFSMDFSPDGQFLAIGGNETFQIWDVINRKLLFESDQLQNHVNILAFSPDGRFLLSTTDRTSVDNKTVITLWGTDQ